MKNVLRFQSGLIGALVFSHLAAAGAAEHAKTFTPPLKVLFVGGGGWHDYDKQIPYLTGKMSELLNVAFEIKTGLDALHDPKFADSFDAVVYDVCFETVSDDILENALQTTRQGKPTVLVHCTVHSFARSPKIRDWETCCGMRSKVHDAYGPFTVSRLDEASPITKLFPDDWKTPGDELYQTISIEPESHQLLKARSPQDGRTHVVCWTYRFGQGSVFATTLGHDMKTISSPDYLRLVANGLLWACGKIQPDGKPAVGYARPENKP
jgi:uncharacterized protein